MAGKTIGAILTVVAAGMLVASACAPTPPLPTVTAPPSETATLPAPAVFTQAEPTIVAQATLIVPATTSETENTPEPPAPTPGETATGGQRVITLDDQGKTVQMKVGESFLLKLGEQLDWAVTISDQKVLSRVPNILVVRGAQGVYTAHQAGTVTLSATGDPPCRQSKPPCMMPSRLFTVTIEILN